MEVTLDVAELTAQIDAASKSPWEAYGPPAIIAFGAVAAAVIGARMISRQITTTRELSDRAQEEERRRLASALYCDLTAVLTSLGAFRAGYKAAYRACRRLKKPAQPGLAFQVPFPEPTLLTSLGKSYGDLSDTAQQSVIVAIQNFVLFRTYVSQLERRENDLTDADIARLERWWMQNFIAFGYAMRALGESAGKDVSHIDQGELDKMRRSLNDRADETDETARANPTEPTANEL